MARGAAGGKLYPFFTISEDYVAAGMGPVRDVSMIVALAATLFVALFGWGSTYFGWSDPEGKIQLALFATFTLGIVCGYKTKG